MKELLNRLFRSPFLAFEIIGVTFLITLLSLAMPLYVIQILNRFITYGFHGTLVTLTVGMCIALVLQVCFKIIRNQMGRAVNQTPNDELSKQVLALITQTKPDILSTVPVSVFHETLNQIRTITKTYNTQTLNAVLDAPFSILLLGVVYLLSPMLAAIACLGIGLALGFNWITHIRSLQSSRQLAAVNMEHQKLNLSLLKEIETLKAFCAIPFLEKRRNSQLSGISTLQSKLANLRELTHIITSNGSVLTSVFVYAAGAVLVVKGELTIGALIGANILFTKAFGSSTRFIQALINLGAAKQAFQSISRVSALPKESSGGAALDTFQGKIEFQDLGFAYPDSPSPLFESVNMSLAPGEVLAITGDNGTGKTTLMKLLAGLQPPKRGQILADGLNISQIDPGWWRNQITYMPQEPGFIPATLKENIMLANPVLTDERLNDILRLSDLRSFIDTSPHGLETRIADNEKALPLGIRQRLALARALAVQGKLVLFDDPTAGMDTTGKQAVYRVLNRLAGVGCTIVVCTADPKILKGTTKILDLNQKPVPRIITGQGSVAQRRA